MYLHLDLLFSGLAWWSSISCESEFAVCAFSFLARSSAPVFLPSLHSSRGMSFVWGIHSALINENRNWLISSGFTRGVIVLLALMASSSHPHRYLDPAAITTTTNALTNNNVPISSPHQSSQIPEGLPIPGPFTSLKDLEFASDLHSEIYRSQFESQFELRHQQNLGLGNEEHGLEDLKKQTQSQVETTRCYSYLSCRSGDYWGNEYDLDGLSAMEVSGAGAAQWM